MGGKGSNQQLILNLWFNSVCRCAGRFYPTLEPGIPDRPFFEDIDPYILGGRFAGILARLSKTEITNIHGGATLGSSFVLR